MKKINYAFQPVPTLTVNGHEFELCLSDSEIFERSLAISKKYAKISKQSSPKVVMDAARECAAIVEDLLGKGAMQIISGGKPVCLADGVAVMILICDAACAGYAGKLAEYE
ncbi:MAG: hypothetical protein RR653_12020 [Clostridia bacterium]